MAKPTARKAPAPRAAATSTGIPEVDTAYAQFMKAYPRARPVGKGYWVDPPRPQRDIPLEDFVHDLETVLGLPATFEENDRKSVDLTWSWNLPSTQLFVWEEAEDDDWIYGIGYT